MFFSHALFFCIKIEDLPNIFAMVNFQKVKKKGLSALLIILIIATLSLTVGMKSAKDSDYVYLGGFPAGFDIETVGATVIGFCDVVTDEGVISPSKDAGIRTGDIILSLGNVSVNGVKDIETAINMNNGKTIVAKIKRDSQTILKEVEVVKDVAGRQKLGLFVRDGISGIGTMTFITKDGDFMALGHQVCNQSGNILKISGGKIYRCSIFGVNKGERGRAGELKGMFINDCEIGSIKTNNEQGILGKIDNFDVSKLNKVEIGTAEIGKASIITCVDGIMPKEFSIQIVKVDDLSRKTKNYVIKVTDESLLNIAGGIVQGMSGSPIMQNGKIVGAVTHVFINDPTRGYGISIDNMLALTE